VNTAFILCSNMKKIEFFIPTKILLKKSSKNKDVFFTLNLNHYRNTHFMVLNTAKKNFTEMILLELLSHKEIKPCSEIEIEYKLFIPNKRRMDVNNILTVVDKFFQDSLVEAGLIPDDSYIQIKKTIFSFGGICKELSSPYVKIIITRLS